MPTYTDFTVTIYQTQNGYELTAHGPGEIAVPPQPIPPELSEQLAAAASQFQYGEALPVEQMEVFGKLLYRVLFPPSITAAYAAAQQMVAPAGHLRLRLAVYPPGLNALPWELLYHPEQKRFLAALLTQPLVRYIESATPVASLYAEKPLRLLYVQSMPADLPPLDLEASQRALAQAWGPAAEITVLRQPTRQALQNALRQPFHALHYDGHAFFDEAAGSSALMLTDEQGNAVALSGADLAYDLAGTSVRLVMLAACQSGMDARRARFSGIAHELMKSSSLPAVIAMQASISDGAAIAFTRGFYHALADEYPLDAATTEGRKAILAAAGGEFATSEWATPVLFLRGAGQIFATPEDAPAPGEPPYKGLQYFDETDTSLFFGRAELSQTLADRLRAENFLAVVGASGSGKSSVVRAGLLPKLRQAGGWTIVSPFTPAMGSEPLLALANALLSLLEPDLSELDCLAEAKKLATHLRGGELSLREVAGRILQKQGAARLALVVDQFEELFTTFREKTALQSEFVNVLLTAVEADSPVSVVITLRADFYAPCAQFAGLRAALENHQAFIGPMTSGELRQAIEEPARLNDWQLEDGLVEMLLRDVGDEPGNLPLLSHALLETWQRRKGRTLTLQGYQQSGGVQGAIARTADAVIHGLNAEQQAVARRIFLGLTELGEGTQDTRRRAALDEIAPQSGMRPAVDAVIKTLADARLVTTSDQSAEVAHEALIREWPTLRRWLDEDRSSLRLHRELNEDAREWCNLNRDAGALYRGARLAAAAEWAETHRDEMTPLDGEFLQASQQAVEQEALEREAQRQRELEQAQRLAKTQRQRTIVLAAGLGVALVLVGVALWFMRSANINLGQANTAGTQAAENLFSAQQNAATATHALGLSEQRGTQAAEQAATAEAASTQAVYQKGQAETQFQAAQRSAASQLAALSQTLFDDFPQRGLLLNIEAFNLLKDNPQPYIPEIEQALRAKLNSSSGWSLPAGEIPAEFITTTHTTWLAGFAKDGALHLHDMYAARLLENPIVLPEAQPPLAVNDLHTRLASGSSSGDIRIWDISVADPSTVTPLVLSGHISQTLSLAFSPNARWLISFAGDQTIRLWDLKANDPSTATRVLLNDIDVSLNPSLNATYTADGHWLVLVVATSHEGVSDMIHCYDFGEIWLFDLSRPTEPSAFKRLEIPDPATTAVNVSPDGRWLAAGDWDGYVRVFDLSISTPWQNPITITTPLQENSVARLIGVVFSSDQHWLAVNSVEADIWLWDWRQPEMPLDPPIHVNEGSWAHLEGFSPDQRWLIGKFTDGELGLSLLRIWDLYASNISSPGYEIPANVQDFFIVDGGRRLVTIREPYDPFNEIPTYTMLDAWDLERFESQVASIPIEYSPVPLTILASSSNGTWFVTTTDDSDMDMKDSTAKLWGLGAGEISSFVLTGLESDLKTGFVDSEGHWLILGSTDGEYRLYELPRPLATDPLVLNSPWYYTAFSPNGRWLYVGNHLWQLGGSNWSGGASISRYYTPAAFSPDSRWLAFYHGKIDLYDLQATAPLAAVETLIGPPSVGGFEALAFSPDQHWLAGGNMRDKRVWLMDLQAEDPSASLVVTQTKDEQTTSVGFSADGNWLISEHYINKSADNRYFNIRLWDLRTTYPLSNSVVLEARPPTLLAKSHPWLFANGRGGRLFVYDLSSPESAQHPLILTPGGASITAIALDETSRRLAVGDSQGNIRLLDANVLFEKELAEVDTLTELASLPGHAGSGVSRIALSSDGEWLASAGNDSTVKLWKLSMLEQIGTPSTLQVPNIVQRMAFSPDGHWLMTADYDNVSIWRFQLQELFDLACRIAGRNFTQAEWQQYFPGEAYRKTCPNLPDAPTPTATPNP